MTSMARCDTEERDPFELAKNIEADHVRIELLDRLQISDPQDRLTNSFDCGIHRLDLRGIIAGLAV